MTPKQLDTLLVEWGAQSKYDEAKREGATESHVLQRGRAYAPGTREKAAKQLVGRDGFSRRRLMARDLGACGIDAVPKSYVSPVAGKQTRKAGPMERVSDSIPPRLKAVHLAALELYRVDKLAGLALRQEYCAYGSQSTKAFRLSEATGEKVGVRVYREALARALGWMLATVSGLVQAA